MMDETLGWALLALFCAVVYCGFRISAAIDDLGDRLHDAERALTRSLDALAKAPAPKVWHMADAQPGSAIVSGVAVDRLPGARPAGRSAMPDGWVDR